MTNYVTTMSEVANVKWVRKGLLPFLELYTLIQDCLDGEVTIKSKRTKYLPKPNPTDETDANILRYDAYLERAVFYNVTARTLKGLVGQVFMRDPVIEIPSELEIVIENADGAGVTIQQSAQKTTAQTLAKGRSGVFTDYPVTEGGATRAELENGNVRPTIHRYNPEQIINWRTKTRGARTILALVVLKEPYEHYVNEFEIEEKTQYRVLKLGEQSEENSPESDVYTVEVWRQNSEGGFGVEENYTPVDANGNPLDEIPFQLIGSENNDAEIDNPPMYDIASLNIAHYRNSADYEESSFVVGQPTVYLAGLTQDWWENVLDKTIQLGSRGGIALPQDASAGLLQADPNQMPKEGMEHKEKQMVALGAKLIEVKTIERTATEVSLETLAENSALSLIANNVSDAYLKALQWCARFAGSDEGSIQFALSTDFDISKLTAEEQRQMVEGWQAGAIAFEEVRERFRKTGIATMDDDKARAAIDKEQEQRRQNEEISNRSQDTDNNVIE